jgi:hypothetical protein
VEQREIKNDLIELSKVKYGIFNVDEWKTILAGIIAKKIDEFNLDDANRDEMHQKISKFLYKQIADFESDYKKENSEDRFILFGMIRNFGSDMFGIFDKMKKNVPKLTNEILNFMEKPENRDQIKTFLIKKLSNYSDETFSEMDYSTQHSILDKYEFESSKDAVAGLKDKLDEMSSYNTTSVLLFFMIVILSLCLITFRNIQKSEYLVFVLFASALLLMGLLLPMIEIDARIAEMSFVLLGESILFEDQVLYFKSKSILEVIYLMFTQGKVELVAVGLLVLLFSVLFPFSKLFCSLLTVFNTRLAKAPIVRFMVSKTGKWSMADVMVIVIFMAYLGFSGILTEQLDQLQHISSSMDILTTNESTLQLGFYMFTAFVLVSLFIAERLSKNYHNT